jgi:hypothetical protein
LFFRNFFSVFFESSKYLSSEEAGDSIINVEIANMHCQGIACTTYFDMGLISAESKKQQCFNSIAYYDLFGSTGKSQTTSKFQNPCS